MPDVVLQLDVARTLGVPQSSVQHMRAQGRIPAPLDLGSARTVAWPASVIAAWGAELREWSAALERQRQSMAAA